ncbi:MAG: hypothetical protein AAFU53_20950 [Cyanobacteria bacterium J06632_3]
MAVPHYPIRSFIKFSVTAQLTADLTGHTLASFVDRPGAPTQQDAIAPNLDSRYAPLVTETASPLDQTLLSELIQTALQPDHHPELYQAYSTQAQARDVEQIVIADIVGAYKTIKLKQLQPQIQDLNALL